METTADASCPNCRRPLPRPGGLCPDCGEHLPGAFRVRPLFLAIVLMIAVAFGAATVFATRFYQAKQQRLGRMYFGRGEAALAARQPQAAIQDFRNALYYSHDNPAYRLRLAEALVAASRISEAQSYLLSLWQDEPSNSLINLQLARLAARQGTIQTALRYYHGAIYGLWPNGDAAARRQQTRLELIHYLLGLKDKTQADAELIALTPELPRDSAAHAQVGNLFLQAGDPDRALQEFQRAMHLNPRDGAAALGAGEAAFKLAQYRAAEYYLERASRLHPHSDQAEQLLATTRMIFDLDPYRKRLNSRQRAARIMQNLRYATRRLDQCAAAKGIAWAPASQPPRAAGAPSAPASPQPASGLVAKILGKVSPQPNHNSSAAPPPPVTPQLPDLHQQALQLQRGLRAYHLQRDPQLADSAMTLVDQIEIVTAERCGAPAQGPDLALLLLARQAEEP